MEKNPRGLSLEEIKRSGYLINPDPVSERAVEESPDIKKRQYELLQKIKEGYRTKKNKKTKSLLEDMYKERELEMLKSGTLRVS